MIALTIIASVCYPLLMLSRWTAAAGAWAIGIYGPLIEHKTPIARYGSEDMFYHEEAHRIKMELRWHSGVVARLSSPVAWYLQWGLALVGIVAAWNTGNHWMLAFPLGSIYLTATAVNLFGKAMLRIHARRYDRIATERKTERLEKPHG